MGARKEEELYEPMGVEGLSMHKNSNQDNFRFEDLKRASGGLHVHAFYMYACVYIALEARGIPSHMHLFSSFIH